MFTAGLDVEQNVVVVVQVSVEDKPHGELCKNKTELRRKRERKGRKSEPRLSAAVRHHMENRARRG